MKKILTIAVASLAVAAIADTFSPQIGVTTLELSQKNNIIPVQFTSLAGAGNVTADALVCTNNIPDGSYLYVFTDNSYKAWYLLAGTGWVAPDVVTEGKVPGELGAEIPSASGVTLNAGSAIWLSFPTAASHSVSVYGKVATSTNVTITAGKSNLICNPKSTSAELHFSSGFNYTIGDKITVVGSTDLFSGYFLYTTAGWKKVTGSKMVSADVITIPGYCGCWYVSNAEGDSPVGEIQW